ncbi:MAG TPA: sigma-70 family RNA polymerase sigma factor, partial [Bryobacteraceae bacterium]|nr:sigma-70 family RNA polymerase sigma factor [Bryobacteraceae bacterium]
MNERGVSEVERVFREEYGRVLASLIRFSGEFDLAEEALQDAFLKAVEAWRETGVPNNPGAWLTTVARRRLIDEVRRAGRWGAIPDGLELVAPVSEEEEPMSDDRLRLIFTCCHPAINREAQVALTLRTLGGLTTPEIARAFLVPETALAQRLVRAKRKMRDAGIPYRVPPPEALAERLAAVQAVLYLIFNEGYAASTDPALIRGNLCAEAIRLTRMLCGLMPLETENRALLALMLLQDSRRAARVGPDGELVTLEAQDRTRWDRAEIDEALALLAGMRTGGRHYCEARIAARHAVAATPEATDWAGIARIYDELYGLLPTPVVELNRAVAVAMAAGPAAGLAAIDRIQGLDGYY